MMIIKRNLFITATSYQFMSAFNLCKELYSSDDFINIIYFLKSEKTNFNFENSLAGFNGKIVRFGIVNWAVIVKDLRNDSFDRFYFFQENSIYNKYLAYYLKKKGTKICLGPDGTKPYGLYTKKHEWLSMLRDTVNDYWLLYSKGLELPKLIWSKYYKYGSFELLDEVWLQYPKLFDSKENKTIGRVIAMPEFTSSNLNLLADIFGFHNTLLEDKNVILYFNQPFHSEPLIEKEFEILSLLAIQFPDRRLHVKLHPSTNPHVEDRMALLPYITIIKDNMPAEFYMAKVSNSIILSNWSAAIMHPIIEQNNKLYYLYPLYKKTKDKVFSQISFFGFPHIQNVEDVTAISW